MRRFFHHFRFSVFGTALACVALGVGILCLHDMAGKAIGYLFGGVLLIIGLIQIVSSMAGESGFLKKLLLVSGVISGVLGVWVLLSPETILAAAVVVLGIVLLFHGAMDIKYAYDIKSCNGKYWWLSAAFGVITAAAGVFLLVNPLKGAEAVTPLLITLMGVGFIFDGLSDIYTSVAVAAARSSFEISSQPVIDVTPTPEQIAAAGAVIVPAEPAVEAETAETEAAE